MLEIRRVELVLAVRAQLGECPLWSETEQKLYWVDIAGRSINCFDPGVGQNRYWPMPAEPGCIALAASGGLVVALRDGFYRFYPADARLEKIAEAPYDHRTTRFNDGRCDGAGRFWAGAMFEPRTTESADMFCLERGKVRLGWGVAGGQGVKVSNGLAFSADGRSVFQADTPNHVIYRFEFDAGTGRVGNRQAFARCPDNRTESNYAGRPDGAAIDADGHYWSAQYEGSRVLRYSMQGEITGVVHMPVRRPTMVAFGGPGLRTMFITTAREGASAEELAAYPQSGGLFACDVGVAGRAEPLYVD